MRAEIAAAGIGKRLTYRRWPLMSALGQSLPIDLTATAANVRFTSNSGQTLAPQRNAALCQKRTYAAQQTQPLFDHLVGEQLHGVRYREAERIGSFRVDNQLELGGLQDRQVAGVCSA
jgi:hypothetical protein